MSTESASKKNRRGQRFNPVKNKGPANRKILQRLHTRLQDYKAMTDRSDFKAPEGAFHRPGSMQK